METKKCLKCQETKPIVEFYTTKSGTTINECTACKILYHKAYRAKNRENILAIDRRHKRKKRSSKGLEEKEEVFVPKKCAKRGCDEMSVQYEDHTRFCKSHALDFIFAIDV